jgi:methionyl aminopeptidase
LIIVKSAAELARMRVAGRIVGEILALLRERIVPGVTTAELDRLAESECRRRKVKPAFKGYGGFPYTICASPNAKVVHGFPDGTPLREGDILSIDFGVVCDGYYGDAAFTAPVGRIDAEAARLLAVTARSLELGIAAALPGGRLSDISHAVQTCVEAEGFSAVREFVGHGIGRALHESPQIPNFGPPGQGPLLKPGMTLAIEPMINAGGPGVKVLGDGWTAVTVDGRLSCHFEHTVAVTDNGPEILTLI